MNDPTAQLQLDQTVAGLISFVGLDMWKWTATDLPIWHVYHLLQNLHQCLSRMIHERTAACVPL